MATYDEISRIWFFLQHPKGLTYEAFERESGLADRERTKRLLDQMRSEAPKTVQRIAGIVACPEAMDGLRTLDGALSPGLAEDWMRGSDPEDPNNDFKLTLSEMAVFFGNVVIKELGGEWRYARMPNYFQSVVSVSGIEILVFDSLMKRLSDDYSGEMLLQKLDLFRAAVARAGGRPH
jgi:hypothetical protein